MNRRTIQIQVLFLRLLALCYLVAFVSLYKQIDVLMSSRGLMPVSATLKAINDRNIPITSAPTLLVWRDQMIQLYDAILGYFPSAELAGYDQTDLIMYLLCLLGIQTSLMAVFSRYFHTYWVYLTCWVIYQSFVTIGGVYFHFQWDILLLEAG